jgi:hypothetical protein
MLERAITLNIFPIFTKKIFTSTHDDKQPDFSSEHNFGSFGVLPPNAF